MQQSHKLTNRHYQPHQQPTNISFDSHLLNRKKTIIEQFLKNQQESPFCLINYPHTQLQQIASQNLEKHGKILIFKSTASVYFGQTCNDLYHGYGLLIYKSKLLRFYQGHFQNNCKYGYGLQYINGDVYIGHFLNNKPQDHNGIFIWSNGDIYHGAFVNGMKHGSGKWQSGDQFYSGSWKFNKPQGQGYIKSLLSQYHGDIKHGYKHGQGVQLFTNADRYEGLYSNGKPEGNGTYAWSNGSIYKGQFRNGLRFGFGIWQYGSQKYEGQYVNDKRNGEGTYTWSGGSYYKGTFVEDLRHGLGKMHWEQESYYKGQWFQGAQNGEGQIWQRGKLIQKGFFQNGKIKIDVPAQQSQRRLFNLPNSGKKLSIRKTTQNLSLFQQKKRLNSFHPRHEASKSQHPKKDRPSHQSFYQSQNENILQRKRQINKRYFFLEKLPVVKKHISVTHDLKEHLKKSNEKSKEKNEQDRSKQKANKPQIKASIAKIQLYKKLRKESKTESIAKKINTVTKLPRSYEEEVMFENQLAPIKWKNFTHVGSH